LSDEFQSLIDACLAGDPVALSQLVDRYKGPVFGLCLRMLNQHQDAEDAAQETFIRAIRSLGRWDRSRRFEPWLLAIAANRCRTQFARRKRRPAAVALLECDLTDRAGELQAAHQLAEEVQLALSEMRDNYAEAFQLFHEQELSYAEIAKKLDCPLGTVKTWVHRARREIIDRLLQRGVIFSPLNSKLQCDKRLLARSASK